MNSKNIILAISTKQNIWEAYTIQNSHLNLINKYKNFEDLSQNAAHEILKSEKEKFEKPAHIKTGHLGYGTFSIYKSNASSDQLQIQNIFIARLIDSENNYEFNRILAKPTDNFYQYAKMEEGISLLDKLTNSSLPTKNYLLFVNENEDLSEPLYMIY